MRNFGLADSRRDAGVLRRAVKWLEALLLGNTDGPMIDRPGDLNREPRVVVLHRANEDEDGC